MAIPYWAFSPREKWEMVVSVVKRGSTYKLREEGMENVIVPVIVVFYTMLLKSKSLYNTNHAGILEKIISIKDKNKTIQKLKDRKSADHILFVDV